MASMDRITVLIAGMLACTAFAWAGDVAGSPQVDVAKYVDEDTVKEIKISPTGEHYAMTVVHDGQVGLLVRSAADLRVTAVLRFTRDIHVDDFWWVSPTRLVVSRAEAFGTRDKPSPTGELFGINADGSGRRPLIGRGVEGPRIGSRMGSHTTSNEVVAFMVDPLANDDDGILISVSSPNQRDAAYHAERLDVRNGQRQRVARAPVGLASYVVDNAGRVRFALGAPGDNRSELYHRADDAAEWQRINDQHQSGEVVIPLGFSADNTIAYLRVSQREGADRLATWDPATGVRTLLPGDAESDPWPVYLDGAGRPIGATYLHAPPTHRFFDDAAPEARLLRSLGNAFPGQHVQVVSSTVDGRTKILLVESDIDPGSFYRFDADTKNADLILVRKQAIDPERMARLAPVSLRARDGLQLRGWLAKPQAAGSAPLPMVVLPHGGPYGEFDTWAYDDDTQLLAEAGYAVLRINFRGSGNYGRAFRVAGAREWGGRMQEDLTDATRWAIEQGIADPSRICIYGASYGGYASLMGVAREPALYRCAVGYVGVYDLPRMQAEDSRGLRALRSWSRDWVGDDRALLARASPVNLADRITAPVLLVAGGEDPVAPIAHTEAMEAALRKAGKPVETYYVRSEGHGFHVPAHRREFYERLLDFLDRNIGARRAGTAP